jgi:GH25 family lysozyme M1 (1,4-beta-N-acetylmuramidase)
MGKSLQEWKNNTLGKVLKVDDDSADCVDVSKDWIVYLTGVDWTKSAGWGNAKDIYAYWSDKYLEKMPAGTAPKLGDIVCMDGSVGGGYGHTGVVIAINGNSIQIAQGNTFTQQAVYTGWWNAYGNYIRYMRPKVAFTEGDVPLAGNQRVVGAQGVNHRDAPSTTAHVRKLWTGGEVLDLGGYYKGESVDGNNIWFVGAHSGGYLHSSGFTDMSTHDLADVTPAKLETYQRQIAGDVMNYRSSPELKPDNVIKTFNPGEVLDFKGYVHGTAVDGNDVWFVGKFTGGFVHSSGFTDTGTHDLPDITPTSTTAPTAPVPTQPASTPLSAKVVDISSNNTITDYAALKSSVRAVIAKAGHTGKSYKGIQPFNGDPSFPVTKANLGDKLVGAYWYGYASLDPIEEAKAFITAVGEVPKTFSYWLDLEELDGKTPAEMREWANDFIDEVEAHIDTKVGLYTYRNFLETNQLQYDVGIINRPIWLAHYDVAEWYNPIGNQVAHQYTSKGSVPGVSGNVDISVVKDAFFIPVPEDVKIDTSNNPGTRPPTTPGKDEPVVVAPTPDPKLPDYVMEIKTVAVNMVVTFFQTFAATWAATGFQLDKVVVAGAIGGALSLVWNTILKPFLIKKGALKQ